MDKLVDMDTPAQTPLPSVSPRRRWLTWGVSLAAALAGAGMAWRQLSPTAAKSVVNNGDDAQNLSDVWSLHFDSPSGKTVVMQAFQGKPLLLNFWATWCPPCVDELPLLNSFFQENSAKSWQVLGVAVDRMDAVQRFLQKTPLNFPVAMAGVEGTDISRNLGNLSGSLPFTVVFDATGRVVHRKMGALSTEELQSLVSAYSV